METQMFELVDSNKRILNLQSLQMQETFNHFNHYVNSF